MRSLPKIELSKCPPSYARLCAYGWDSIQEAHALVPSERFIKFLEAAQAEARSIDEMSGVVLRDIGREPFKVQARGAKRFRFRFENDDFIIFIGSEKLSYAVSLRYSPAGLCEHGWTTLRDRALRVLRSGVCAPFQDTDQNMVRVSRADWFWDFYAPTLASELRFGIAANVVCHSSVKKFETTQTIGTGDNAQTLTIGTRSSLQMQFYDKAREIVEASGKEWLYHVWAEGLGEWPWHGRPRDVFRLEARMFRDFLRDRNCRSPVDVEKQRERLLTEALYMRRLTVPQDNDSNRCRWPMHPIFSEAVRNSGVAELLPLGRKVTGRRDELMLQAEKQLTGITRAATVLKCGECNDADALALMRRALDRMALDPRHSAKVKAAKDRYSDVDEAR